MTRKRKKKPSLWERLLAWEHRVTSARARASYKRTLKIAFYYLLGYVLAYGAFLVVYLLTKMSVDQLTVNAVGGVVAAITGGLHKAINWQTAGLSSASIPVPPADATKLPEVPSQESEESEGEQTNVG